MKKGIRILPPVLLVTLVAFLFLPVGRLLAQAPDRGTGYSTNASDQTACQRQLNLIYGGIQQYREQHGGQPPDKLSDLVPDLIHDPGVLTCPYVQKRGGLRTWKKRFRDLASDPHTSYSYEFPPTPLDLNHWRGLPMKTWREFKERQMVEVGSVLPLVRCLDHRPCLNLAVGGQIYESDTYWEKNFSQDDHLLTVANLFRVQAAQRPLSEKDFPPRDAHAAARFLDLTAHYNATLTNSWQGFSGNHLGNLPMGIREFDNVPFDVRGVIQLNGTELPVDFPNQVAGINVRQKCDRIHFLHATCFTYLANTVQAFYTIHYADGAVREFPVVYGQHIADWWREPGSTTALTNATVAWTGKNEAATAYGMVLGLYHAVWDNPLKDSEIATITFGSVTKPFQPGAFVVAITVE